MLNKIHKKIVIALAMLILASTAGQYADGAKAQTIGANNSSSCPITNYFDDFDIFLTSLVSYDDFVEYFKDIFTRNNCHRDDIFALQTQLEKQNAQVRKAYENCQVGNLPKLKDKAYKLQMEIMYLRKFVINNPDKASGAKEIIAVPKEAVKSQLENYFVNDKEIYKNSAAFLTVYNEVLKKYASKLNDYNNCKDATWEELTQKWNEFLQTAGGLSTGLDKMKKSIEKKEKKLNESPPNRKGSFLEKITEMRVNGVKPREGLSEIYNEFNKNLPQGSLGGYGELLQNVQSAKKTYELEVSEAELLGKYKMLYGEDTDPAVATLVQKIGELNQTLKDTFPVQNSLFECSKKIREKQCKNKSE